MSPNSLTGRPPAFVYRKGKGQKNLELYCENVGIDQLADKLNTPLYVYSANAIRERLRLLTGLFVQFLTRFAIR